MNTMGRMFIEGPQNNVAWENSQHFAMPPLVSREMTSDNQVQKFQIPILPKCFHKSLCWILNYSLHSGQLLNIATSVCNIFFFFAWFLSILKIKIVCFHILSGARKQMK